MAAISALYYIAGHAALRLAALHPSISPVWPGTGIALAALLLFGRGVWPAIFLGAFVVNATGPAAGVPLAINLTQAGGLALGNTLEAVVGASFVERFARGRNAFQSVAGIFYYTLFAGALSTGIAATLGTFTLLSCGLLAPDAYGALWFT